MRRPWLYPLLMTPLLWAGAAAAQAPAQPAGGPGPAWAAGGPGARGPHGGMGERAGQGDRLWMLGRLGLDEAQMAKVKAVHVEAQKAEVRQQAEVRVAEIELRELLGATAPDRKKIHAQIDKVTRLRGDLQKLRVDQRLDVLAVLTPQQRAKMAQLRQQRPGWRGAGPRDGRGAGDGGRGLWQRRPGWEPTPGDTPEPDDD